MNLENSLYSWNNLSYSLNVQNGGTASNFIILGLTIGWTFCLNKSPELSIITIIIHAVSFVFIFFGTDVFQTTTIYNISFQIPAAFTLYYLSQTKHIGKIFAISIILILITISLRYILIWFLNTMDGVSYREMKIISIKTL